MLPHLYTDLAPWWPLLSPEDAYIDDAGLVHALVHDTLGRRPESILELGCGSGTLASHFPADLHVASALCASPAPSTPCSSTTL